jgi:hypothetical protein
MASEVDICNLALGHLGDNATVSSISPPEGSAQSEHCARFYPIARDALLEMHNWNFSMRRVNLAEIANNWPEWKYSYVLPGDSINIIAVMPPQANDDYASRFVPTDTPDFAHNYSPVIAAGRYSPQPFSVEIASDGNHVLYTNQEEAMLRYTCYVTDTTSFSPLFVMTLSWQLAAMLAGPVIKGDAGSAEAKRCTQMAMGYMSQAKVSDSNQRRNNIEHIVPWSAGR